MVDYPFKEIGARLRVLRGVESQKSFARRVGVQAQQYNRYEKGRGKPPSDVLERVARHTGASIDWILFGGGSRSAERSAVEHSEARESRGLYGGEQEDRLKESLADLNKSLDSLGLDVSEEQRAALIDYVFRSRPDLFAITDLLRLLVRLDVIKRRE